LLTEINRAESELLKFAQDGNFLSEKNIRHLEPCKGDDGLIRIKTRLFLRDDTPEFLCPIVLPHSHSIVRLLIREHHERVGHMGVRITLSSLRKKFWVLKGRQAVRSVISKCEICKRHDLKPLTAPPSLLPFDRVRDAAVFEVVFRAVHLELLTGLDVPKFLMGLRRFISRRGRPSLIYSDNGTNFTGLNKSMQRLNFEDIAAAVVVQRIEWKFNPPGTPWWGGFWERLIGVLKRSLRRTLGKTCLDYEEMMTVLLDCEAVVNSRPITFMSDDGDGVVPLTPAHFLQETRQIGVVDLDKIEAVDFKKRYSYRQEVKNNLRKRFRSEYLGTLSRQKIKTKNEQSVKVCDVVLIGCDDKKRIDWPLARIGQVVPGKDGKIRMVRVITAKGKVVRVAVQRIYPLEVSCEHDPNFLDNFERKYDVKCGTSDERKQKSKASKDVCDPNDEEIVSSKEQPSPRVTRSGRKIVSPERLIYYK